jgi:hypothetical protein
MMSVVSSERRLRQGAQERREKHDTREHTMAATRRVAAVPIHS